VIDFALPQCDRVRLKDFVDRSEGLDSIAFANAALQFLQARYLIDQIERERIPETGPVVIVANHPLGAIDALCLISAIGAVRRDLKIMANQWLSALTPLQPILIGVNVMAAGGNLGAYRAAQSSLANGGAVIVFPAGIVSRLGWQGIQDSQWSKRFLRLAQDHKAGILPVNIRAKNSALFYALGAFPLMGTLRLPREMFAQPDRRVELRIGPIQNAHNANLPRPSDWQRLIQKLPQLEAQLRADAPQAIAHSKRQREWISELSAAQLLGETPDGKRILLARCALGSALLAEIGRLRELSFRAVGEGTSGALQLMRWLGTPILETQAAFSVAVSAGP